MTTPEFKNNKERYLFHLEEFKSFSGSASEYCVQNELKASMFSFYKRKQQRKERNQFAALKIEHQPIYESKNIPTKMIRSEPEWMAEVIYHLLMLK